MGEIRSSRVRVLEWATFHLGFEYVNGIRETLAYTCAHHLTQTIDSD